MEKFKFTLLSIIVLAILGLVSYWSIKTIESGSEHTAAEKIKQLQAANEELNKKVEDLSDELAVLKPVEEPMVADTAEPTSVVKEEPKSTTTVYKYQTLINELQDLVKGNITMKLKSSGTRVGTVQKFLNIYNNTSNKVDNDYGATTVTLVKAFQKAEGMTADGEAGPSTFKKMIEWLKKQG
jgi:murein L,D-transpeptidase YcbB/YkuD